MRGVCKTKCSDLSPADEIFRESGCFVEIIRTQVQILNKHDTSRQRFIFTACRESGEVAKRAREREGRPKRKYGTTDCINLIKCYRIKNIQIKIGTGDKAERELVAGS